MKDKELFYNEEFSKALEYCKNNDLFLGEGTPNADILIIGKECGFDKKKRKSLDDAPNKEKWLLENSEEEAISNINRLENDYQNNKNTGLPKLKADIKSHATWRSYHRLVSLIKGVNKDEITKGGKNDWGFLDHCFITEVSQLQLPNSSYLKKNDISDDIRRKSVEKRAQLFQQPFFRRFPIVIIASGPDYLNIGKYGYDFDIEREFNVKYHGQTVEVIEEGYKKRWYNIHTENEGEPRIVIHTRQLSTRGESASSLDLLMEKIAEESIPYLRK